MVGQGAGRLHVVATPIGNLEDASPRALRTLREADWIACEDTRHSARLCAHFGIDTERLSLHAHNEAARTPDLVARLLAGQHGALISDAGTPLVSDPGERLVRAAIEAGVEVIAIPGPVAAVTALVASGLPAQPFLFVGFLPRKGRARSEAIAQIAATSATSVVYESPQRVAGTLAELAAVLGPRRVSIARELTKLHETHLRGVLGEVELDTARGEVTLVIAPAEPAPAVEDAQLRSRAAELLAAGSSARDAARALATEFEVGRSRAYGVVQSLRDDD